MSAGPATVLNCRRSTGVLCMARSSSRSNGKQPAQRPVYWASEQAEQLVDRAAAGEKLIFGKNSSISDIAAALELTERQVRCLTVVLEAMEALRQAIAAGSPSSEGNQLCMTAADAQRVLLQSGNMDEHLSNIVCQSLKLEADSTLTNAALATAIYKFRADRDRAQLVLQQGQGLLEMIEQRQAADQKPADPASCPWWPLTPRAKRRRAAASNSSKASDPLRSKGDPTACRVHICVLGADVVGLSSAVRLAEELQNVKVTALLLTFICAW